MLIVSAVLLFFSILRVIKVHNIDVISVLLFLLSAYILFSILTLPLHTAWLHDNWMSGASFIGNINGQILLTIIFFIVLFPMSILIKLLNRKRTFLNKPMENGTFILEEYTYKKDNFKNLW